MAIKIPPDVLIEMSLFMQGKKIMERPKIVHCYEDLLMLARRNIIFLNDVANTGLIHSFLKDPKRIILILDNFNPYSELIKDAGQLVLSKLLYKTALYYHIGYDHSIDKIDQDYILVTDIGINKWHLDSLEQFALLREKDIWENIKKWIRVMRT